MTAVPAAITGMVDQVPELALMLLALACFVFSALTSAGEAALQRVSRGALEDAAQDAEHGADRYGRALALVEDRAVAVAAASFVRASVDMVAAVCVTLVVADLLPEWWQVLVVSVVVVLLVLGLAVGASPRSLGRRNPTGVLAALEPLLRLYYVSFRPLVRLWAAARPQSPLTDSEARAEVVDDLREMVDRVVESEPIEEEDRELIRSVFELGQTLTREVMVPRTEMVTVDWDTPLDDAMMLHVRSGFSRIPVVGDDTDDPRGISYVKDLVRRAHRHPEAMAGLTLADVMRPASFVPETKVIDDLLREMQADSVHIALAVDEYGGIAGLVTIEDVLEEIVGEMRDEHDHDEPEVEVVEAATGPDGEGMVVRVPARTPIDEAGELFDLEIEDDDVDTVGGLLAKALGKVPIVGNEVDALGLHLVAERVEGRRKQVSTVLVSRTEVREDDDHAPDRDGERVAARAVGSRDLPGHEAQEDRAR